MNNFGVGGGGAHLLIGSAGIPELHSRLSEITVENSE